MVSNNDLLATVQGERLFVAASALVVYDHVITFGQEVAYFWSGSWSISRSLYLSIRYVSLGNVLLMTLAYFHQMTTSGCYGVVRFVYASTTAVLLLSQAVFSLRVYYLFSHSKKVQRFIALLFFSCVVAETFMMAFSYHNNNIEIINFNSSTVNSNSSIVSSNSSTINSNSSNNNITSCVYLPKPSAVVWHNFIPSVILQLFMYAMTLYRLMKSTTSVRSPTFIVRFLNEGGPMYFAATGALVYTIASVSMEDEIIRITGLDSYFTYATIAVAVCHVLLSIRTLAARYEVDQSWLLSHTELSRLQCKRGADGELLVDMGSDQGSNVELNVQSAEPRDNELQVWTKVRPLSHPVTATSGFSGSS